MNTKISLKQRSLYWTTAAVLVLQCPSIVYGMEKDEESRRPYWAKTPEMQNNIIDIPLDYQNDSFFNDKNKKIHHLAIDRYKDSVSVKAYTIQGNDKIVIGSNIPKEIILSSAIHEIEKSFLQFNILKISNKIELKKIKDDVQNDYLEIISNIPIEFSQDFSTFPNDLRIWEEAPNINDNQLQWRKNEKIRCYWEGAKETLQQAGTSEAVNALYNKGYKNFEDWDSKQLYLLGKSLIGENQGLDVAEKLSEMLLARGEQHSSVYFSKAHYLQGEIHRSKNNFAQAFNHYHYSWEAIRNDYNATLEELTYYNHQDRFGDWSGQALFILGKHKDHLITHPWFSKAMFLLMNQNFPDLDLAHASYNSIDLSGTSIGKEAVLTLIGSFKTKNIFINLSDTNLIIDTDIQKAVNAKDNHLDINLSGCKSADPQLYGHNRNNDKTVDLTNLKSINIAGLQWQAPPWSCATELTFAYTDGTQKICGAGKPTTNPQQALDTTIIEKIVIEKIESSGYCNKDSNILTNLYTFHTHSRQLSGGFYHAQEKKNEIFLKNHSINKLYIFCGSIVDAIIGEYSYHKAQ